MLFWRLGEPTFWEPDEAHYAETSREMVATGDWLAPYYNGEAFFDKPALFHFLQAAAMRLFGSTEFAARFVPALAALVLLGVTTWFGAVAFDRDVGFSGALLLGASPGIFALARYAIFDTLFTAFEFAGVALLGVAALRDRPRLQYPGYVLIALAVLTKGPLALVLCGLAFVIAIVVSPDARRRLLELHWFAGLVLVVLLSAPWFVYMYIRFGQAFLNGYLLDENLRLYVGRRFANQPGAWFYFQILAAGLLPWTGLAVGRFIDDVKTIGRRERLDSVEVLLWAWALAVIGFFTLSTFKLDHYIFPAAPALYLLCARALFDARSDNGDPRHAGVRFGLQLVGPLLVATGCGAGVFLIMRGDLPAISFVVPIALTLVGGFVTARLSRRGASSIAVPTLVTLVVGGMMVTYAGIIVCVLPALERQKVVPGMARWVADHASPSDRVAVFRLNRWTNVFRFYVNRPTVHLESAEQAAEFFTEPGPFYCAMLERSYEAFVAEGLPLTVVQARDGMWATSGRALWRRRLPPTRFVIVTRALQR